MPLPRLAGLAVEARCLATASCVLAMATLACGGCSVSMPMGGLGFDTETTGSLKPKPVSPLSAELDGEDWRRAKSAMATALDPVGSGAAVAWDNPDSGLKGTIVPVGSPFVKADEICRAFVATITARGASRSLQATGCRISGPEWAVKDVKPWNKPA